MGKKTMKVYEMRKLLGIGKTESYWLLRKHYFRTIYVDGKIRVDVDSFEEWYKNQFWYKKVDGEPPGANWKHTYSVQEIADMLGITGSPIYELMAKGCLVYYKVGNFRRIDKASFENWYASQSHYRKKSDDEQKLTTLQKDRDTKNNATTYSVDEACAILGVSKKEIYRMIGEKVFTTIQYKNCYRIIKSSFDEVLNEFKEDVNGSNSKEE